MPPMSASSDSPIPLGPFRLERRIGLGRMAEVWAGVHAAQQVPVAVKVMTGERARNPQYLAAFRNEVRSVASLDHPGIVLVFDHGEVSYETEEASRGVLPAGRPCLAMELSDRGTLAGLPRRSGTGPSSGASSSPCSTRSPMPTPAGWSIATSSRPTSSSSATG
jgi:serine/threonine protein kinase